MLDVERASVTLGGVRVLADVSLRVERGGWLGIIGPNGAGKSTLVRAVAGLVPYEGRILISGKEHSVPDHRSRARSVAYVPQRPVLPRAMTVTDYVLLGRSAHHSYLGAESARDRRVTAVVLDRLDLTSFARRPLGELSGGESQRVVLARALVQEAPVLAMDEPTTSLDLGHSQLVLELADELRREKGLCVLCAIHDLTLAAQFAERLLVLSHGKVVVSGAPSEVLSEANVKRFFDAEVEVMTGLSGLVVSPVRRHVLLPTASDVKADGAVPTPVPYPIVSSLLVASGAPPTGAIPAVSGVPAVSRVPAACHVPASAASTDVSQLNDTEERAP